MSGPVEAFVEVARGHRRMFWLDGGGARAWSGRRSIVGWLAEDDVSLVYDAAARQVWRARGSSYECVGEDIFTALEEAMAEDRDDESVHWVGYFGYACRPDLPARTGAGVPDAVWMRTRNVRVFEHQPPERRAASVEFSGQDAPRQGDLEGKMRRVGGYGRAFAEVQEQLHAGNTYEVNLTYRERVVSDLDPVTAYLRLRELNPAPYACYLQHDVPEARVHLLSSSPERFATIDRQRRLETKPIKGSSPRGATAAEDALLAARLADDPKCRAENLMITDLLRNDLSLVCDVGSVEVPHLMEVESYPSVHQLVSTVRGLLRPDVSTIAALRALFPAGSMTGAPKLRTMHVIADVEDSPRGAYAGAVGWISGDGRADLGVVIRSLVTDGAGSFELGTGGGITVLSDEAEEWDESRWKAERLLGALTR